MDLDHKCSLNYQTFNSNNSTDSGKPSHCQVSINHSPSKMDFRDGYREISMDAFTAHLSSHDSRHSLSTNDKEPLFKTNCGSQCLKNRVRYHFMNPFEKFRVKHTIPYKLIITVINLILISSQIYTFENHVYSYAQEHRDTEITLRNVFLKDWASERDIAAYPSSLGPYAVYTKGQFYDHLNFAIEKFGEFENSNLGAYTYNYQNGKPLPLKFCQHYFSNWQTFTKNHTIKLDLDPAKKCIDIPTETIQNKFSIAEVLSHKNSSIYFPMLINVNLRFFVNLVFSKSMTEVKMPTCYKMLVDILYDNSQHDGQILISLATKAEQMPCQIEMENADSSYAWRQATNYLVIIISSILSLLIFISIYKSFILRKEVVRYFKQSYDVKLSFGDRFEFWNLWFFLTLVGNFFIIIGSFAKIAIEAGTNNDNLYNVCSVLLGTGNLINWIGLLRYMSYFKEYNIMLVTVKRGFSILLKAMLCALFVYMGFMVCGWVVLAPYHPKFVFLSTTSETLYSLMYGDDMFATFATLDTPSSLIWFFSRIYLYTYIFAFICIILSIIIAIVLDVYDNVKLKFPTEGNPDELNLENFRKFSRIESIDNLRQIFLKSGSSKCFCESA